MLPHHFRFALLLPMPRIAFVTCCELPEPDVDQDLMLQAVPHSEMAAWDDETVDWSSYDLAVLRSPWNYPCAPSEFISWLHRTATVTKLLNPIEFVRPNLHKGYLLQLIAREIPCVPTHVAVKGSPEKLGDICADRGWSRIVIKPAIGAGSYLTKIFDSPEEGVSFWNEQLRERDLLVQPCIESVFTVGEQSLIFIDGEFTHRIIKRPRFDGEEEGVMLGRPLNDQEKEFGLRVLGESASKLLYARVDVMFDDNGQFLLSELELTEPSLFFKQGPAALDRFATACIRSADTRAPV